MNIHVYAINGKVTETMNLKGGVHWKGGREDRENDVIIF